MVSQKQPQCGSRKHVSIGRYRYLAYIQIQMNLSAVNCFVPTFGLPKFGVFGKFSEVQVFGGRGDHGRRKNFLQMGDNSGFFQ